MDVAMMQPAFLPWQGYFELIYKSDIFIFLDDFQFSVQNRHQRNKLFINKGNEGWYTIPIKKSISFAAPINKALINEDIPWRKKMLKRIQQNYSKAPFFSEFSSFIERWLLNPADNLAAQDISLIKFISETLGLKAKFYYSSEFFSQEKRSERVLELLKTVNARRYFCAKGAFSYMKSDGIFPVDEIEVLFQDFHPAFYPQAGAVSGFVPNLSVLDALFNVGAKKTLELIINGTPRWLTWKDMRQVELNIS